MVVTQLPHPLIKLTNSLDTAADTGLTYSSTLIGAWPSSPGIAYTHLKWFCSYPAQMIPLPACEVWCSPGLCPGSTNFALSLLNLHHSKWMDFPSTNTSTMSFSSQLKSVFHSQNLTVFSLHINDIILYLISTYVTSPPIPTPFSFSGIVHSLVSSQVDKSKVKYSCVSKATIFRNICEKKRNSRFQSFDNV